MDDFQWLKTSLDELKADTSKCCERLTRIEIDLAGLKVKASIMWCFIGGLMASIGAVLMEKL
jgi:hypothetical protein